MNLGKFISILFHPSNSTLLGFLIIFLLRCENELVDFLDIVFFFSIMPFLITLILRKMGKISDLFVTKREERGKVITLALIGYILGLFILYIDFSPILFYLSIAYVVNTVIILAISTKYKISIHVATITAIATALTMILGIKFLAFYLLSIMVGIARIKIKAHTIDQVTSAFILATIITFIQIKIFLG
ncbi:hypothetical protein [Acidianus sp. HS-5]|uniref:hypothetical protein n=1 Tax=Acidianus sp. HS-5 TaxID=2886040 RepID=UPI001F17E0D2|nr:hypothetical protein [Acidianus sp. HS-5]BDC17197.1 hypothetical protein HS5_00870 [Acidianus sp. HS-5]